jgi:hypothetical protein
MNRMHAVICSSGRWQKIAERELLPGGLFAGTDSLGQGLLFRVLQIGDTLVPVVPVAPDGLADRLHTAGLAGTVVSQSASSFRFRARKPAAAAR